MNWNVFHVYGDLNPQKEKHIASFSDMHDSYNYAKKKIDETRKANIVSHVVIEEKPITDGLSALFGDLITIMGIIPIIGKKASEMCIIYEITEVR